MFLRDITVLWLDDDRTDPQKYLFGKDSQTDDESVKAKNRRFYSELAQHANINFDVVMNLAQFRRYIEENGVPDMVSFDFDLKKGNMLKYGDDGEWDGENGADCAAFLKSWCDEHGQSFPKYYIHSANRKRIPEIEAAIRGTTGRTDIDIEGPAQGVIDIGSQAGNNLWFTSVTPENVIRKKSPKSKSGIKDGSIASLSGRKAFDKCTTWNPMFLSKNFEYSYSYARTYQFRHPAETYIAVVETTIPEKKFFNLTDPDDFAKLFGDDIGAYELFREYEPYFSWNSNMTAMDKKRLMPVEYYLTRLYIEWKNADKLGISKDEFVKASDNTAEDGKTDMKQLKHHTVSFVDIIFNEGMTSDDIPNSITDADYSVFRDSYDMAVFERSLKKDASGNYLRDPDTGAYVKTRWGEYLASIGRSPHGNENVNRACCRDTEERTHRRGTKTAEYDHKILNTEIPPVLNEKQKKFVNIYLAMTKKIRVFAEKSAAEKGVGLFDFGQSVIAASKQDDVMKPGYVSPYIEPLQYMLFELIKDGNSQWHGAYCPETVGVKAKKFLDQRGVGKKITSADDTIIMWNPDGMKLVMLIPWSLVDDRFAEKMFTQKTGKHYTDADVRRIMEYAKANDPHIRLELLQRERLRKAGTHAADLINTKIGDLEAEIDAADIERELGFFYQWLETHDTWSDKIISVRAQIIKNIDMAIWRADTGLTKWQNAIDDGHGPRGERVNVCAEHARRQEKRLALFRNWQKDFKKRTVEWTQRVYEKEVRELIRELEDGIKKSENTQSKQKVKILRPLLKKATAALNGARNAVREGRVRDVDAEKSQSQDVGKYTAGDIDRLESLRNTITGLIDAAREDVSTSSSGIDEYRERIERAWNQAQAASKIKNPSKRLEALVKAKREINNSRQACVMFYNDNAEKRGEPSGYYLGIPEWQQLSQTIGQRKREITGWIKAAEKEIARKPMTESVPTAFSRMLSDGFWRG